MQQINVTPFFFLVSYNQGCARFQKQKINNRFSKTNVKKTIFLVIFSFHQICIFKGLIFEKILLSENFQKFERFLPKKCVLNEFTSLKKIRSSKVKTNFLSTTIKIAIKMLFHMIKRTIVFKTDRFDSYVFLSTLLSK